MITNTSYLLEAHEELWQKELPLDVSLLLQSDGAYCVSSPPKLDNKRIKHKVVTFTVPHNAVTQVFDYQNK